MYNHPDSRFVLDTPADVAVKSRTFLLPKPLSDTCLGMEMDPFKITGEYSRNKRRGTD